MNRTAGFGAPKQPAKAQPAKASSGFGAPAQQQQGQQSQPAKTYQTGSGSRGPWARLSGGLPQGQGGTNTFFFPSKDPAKVEISATSWSQNKSQCSMGNGCPNRNRALRASITKANIVYENGVVKIPLTIRMKVPQAEAMQFSKDVLEAVAQAVQEEAAPSETD